MNRSTEPRWRMLGRTNLDQQKKRAKELLRDYRREMAQAGELFERFHPDPPQHGAAKLSDAQLVIARAHDFASWPRFGRAVVLYNAMLDDDADAVLAMLRRHPELLHERVNGATSNWGPPLACAAQIGASRVFAALLPIPGQDRDWALDRAILKGRSEFARQLINAGTVPAPGVVMGPCETLNLSGLEFLADIGAPLTDEDGNPLKPVALLLEGYYRDPAAKHACLDFFERQGITYPDTPAMAFHRGRIRDLERHLENDASLLARRFVHREIYPPELGCHEDESLALHGTPLDGTTLLHLAIDFDERDVGTWLIQRGADVNARASHDDDGFGGHTPLHGTVVSQAYRSGRQRDAAFARMLLHHGADPAVKASIRKRIRFIEDESLHEYRDVTPVEYGRRFHAREWVSEEAIARMEQHAAP